MIKVFSDGECELVYKRYTGIHNFANSCRGFTINRNCISHGFTKKINIYKVETKTWGYLLT